MRGVKLVAASLIILALALFSYRGINLYRQVNQLELELEDVKTTLATLATYEKQATTQDYVVIFLIESTPTNFFLVPVKRPIGGPVNPGIALQTLLNGPLAHENLHESVPHTTRLLGLSIFEGLAVANFSSELVDDFNGGSLIESYLVQAIVSTLTEFPEIDRVQILVEGEEIESIGGHVLITGPLTRDN
ncbi:MAG: GerMN domain-containing protein [Firmicutes bacterium]|nr:GerMN domain-containing protein [Bacillota bacterium]